MSLKKRAPKKNTIRYNIAVHSVRASMLLVLLAIVSLTIVAEIYLTLRTERLQVAIAKQLRNDITGWFDTQSASLDSIANVVEYMYDKGYATPDEVQQYLSNCLDKSESLFDIYIGFEDGQMRYASGYQPDETYDPRERNWYRNAAEQGGLSVSEIYVDYQTGKYCITISKPVICNGELLGVVGADLYADDVIELAAKADENTMGYTIIVDKDGNVLTHKKPEYTPAFSEDGSAKLTKYSEVGLEDKLIEPSADMKKQYSFHGVYRSITEEDMGMTIISAMDWYVYFRPTNIILALAILLLIITFCVVRDSLRYALPKLLAPLGELEVVAEYMSMGFLNYEAKYKLDDEIGNLCNAVEISNRVIKEYIQEVSEDLANMGQGDFSRKIETEYTGAFLPLKEAVNEAFFSLSAIALEMHEHVDLLYRYVQDAKAGKEVDMAAMEDELTQLYWVIDNLEYMNDEDEEGEVLETL